MALRARVQAMTAPAPGKAPCGTCPYRRGVPSGVWHPSEYAKLPEYDGETFEQPPALFFCHQQDGKLCAGWVGCHDTRHLLALRFHRVAPETFDYVSPVPLFASGAEAAAHGLARVEAPDSRARLAMQKLLRKRARDSDGSREAGETPKSGSTRSATARAEGIAQPTGQQQ
jgi:hypothetical protein